MSFNLTELNKMESQLSSMRDQIDSLLNSALFIDNNCKDAEEEKVAVYSATSNCFDFMKVSIKSLLYNSDVDKIFVISDVDNLPDDFPNEIINIAFKTPPEYIYPDGPNIKSIYKAHGLYKLALHRIFPEYNKVLYLDYDTVVKRDISKIWDVQLGDRYYFAGVPEINKYIKYQTGFFPKRDFMATSLEKYDKITYINSGVLLANLRCLREDGVGDIMIDRVNDEKYILPDQDVINDVCKGRIYLLPGEWNANRFADLVPRPRIIHYAGQEKSLEYEDVAEFRDMPWNRVQEHREITYKKRISFSSENMLLPIETIFKDTNGSE